MAARIRLTSHELAAMSGATPSPRRQSKSQPEGKIVAAVLRYLHDRGIYAWRNNSVGVFDPVRKVFRKNKAVKRGVSDILALHHGKFIAIEIKTKTGKLSAEQAEFLSDVNQRGGLAFCARSVADVEAAFAKELFT